MENYNFSDLITFTRTTNATLVDGTGNVTYAPNNLFTNSEAFEAAAWVKGNSTVTANATVAPNGTTTADKSVENTATSTHQITQQTAFVSGTSYTWSFYVKAAERSAVRVLFPAAAFTSNLTANFDLATGAWRTSSPAPSAGLTLASQDVGNGWYRISATATATASLNQTILLYLLDTPSGTGSYTGNGTSGLFLWGAQLEAVTYQTTAGTYNSTSPPNLLGFTQEFENAGWAKSFAAVTANATTSPDGTTNADSLTADGTANPHVASQTVTFTAAAHTLSVYAKKDTNNFLQLRFGTGAIAGGTGFANFDLNAGTVGTVGAGLSAASITPAGGGWYRCTITGTTLAASSNAAFYVVTSASSTSGQTNTLTTSVFLWGAQLSNSASVDPYVYNPGAAPTSTAYYGPRFDYNPLTLAPRGLLIEEQRVNLLLYSDQFDNAGWTKAGATITANATTSPDGTANADKLVENTALAQHRVQQAVTTVIGTSYTHTIYLKAGERTTATLRVIGATTFAGCTINLTAGTISGVTGVGTITNAGNGWYRVSVAGTADSTTSTCFVNLADAGNNTYTGDGVSGAFLWGAQLEAGAFATSYIPTVASTVTRAADIAVMSGSNFSSWYNQSEGTIVVQASTQRTSGSAVRAVQIDDGTTDNRNSISFDGTSPSTTINAATIVGGVAQAAFGLPVAPLLVANFAYAYRANDFAACVNAVGVSTDTSGTVPSGLIAMRIGSLVGGIQQLNGHIRSITFYPYRLADFQLQALTA